MDLTQKNSLRDRTNHPARKNREVLYRDQKIKNNYIWNNKYVTHIL